MIVNDSEKILKRDIVTKFVKSSDQLADIFSKSLTSPHISYICYKLDTTDLYAPLKGSVRIGSMKNPTWIRIVM